MDLRVASTAGNGSDESALILLTVKRSELWRLKNGFAGHRAHYLLLEKILDKDELKAIDNTFLELIQNEENFDFVYQDEIPLGDADCFYSRGNYTSI